MLRFVTKEQYWNILDKGIMECVPKTDSWHLKDIQDAAAYSHLYETSGLDIAEIGAGNSRLIELIAKDNHCSIIDEYKGFGGGPKFKPKTNNKINFIDCMVGKSQGVIKDQAFDVVFSISVVEHVPTQDLQGFFTDCHRILKPKGIMLHLIDAYVEDNLGSNQDLWKRIIEYRNALTNNLFEPVGEIKFSLIEDIAFRSAYATNPDNMMRRWNISSPTLVKKRMTAQSCTIEMMGRKR